MDFWRRYSEKGAGSANSRTGFTLIYAVGKLAQTEEMHARKIFYSTDESTLHYIQDGATST